MSELTASFTSISNQREVLPVAVRWSWFLSPAMPASCPALVQSVGAVKSHVEPPLLDDEDALVEELLDELDEDVPDDELLDALDEDDVTPDCAPDPPNPAPPAPPPPTPVSIVPPCAQAVSTAPTHDKRKT